MARFFLKLITMTKNLLFIGLFFAVISVNGQRGQRIAYIDMEYILENLPEYNNALNKIDSRANDWQYTLNEMQKEIDDLYAELRNEKEILTEDLIEEKKDDIRVKEMEMKKMKKAYFGTEGDLFFYRRQLVNPVQDLVYNTVQDIAKKRKYDFVLDKSTDLIMLYTNKQHDISDIVLKSIKRIKTVEDNNKKRKKRSKNDDENSEKIISEEAQKKLDERNAKKAAMKKKADDKREAAKKLREEKMKAAEEDRQKRIEEREKARENSSD